MFTKSETPLDQEIARLLEMLSSEDVGSDRYAQIADQLVKLYKLQEVHNTKQVSADTIATIIANLAGIIVIVGHERAHVVTSKAVSFLTKLR
jgi:hypothetical protein